MVDFSVNHDCTVTCVTSTFIVGAVPMIPSHSDDEEGTAFHEAGHAIVGAVRDRPPLWVTIIAADGASGKTEFPDDVLPEYKRVLSHSPKNASISKPAF